MFAGTKLRAALTGIALSTLSLTTLQGTATAADFPARTSSHAPTTGGSPVAAIEGATARALARSLAEPTWRRQLAHAALAQQEVDLLALTAKSGAGPVKGFRAALVEAEAGIAEAKGLGEGVPSLLRVGLAGQKVDESALASAEPLVASAPADDDAEVVVAYDSAGVAHELDAATAPQRPVYVVGVDGQKALAAGLEVIERELAARGLDSASPTAASPSTVSPSTASAATGFWTTRIKSIGIADVKEPWFKSDAEIFSLVTGFGTDGKVRVDTVTMPYLDDEGTTYYPNQILVNWSNYKYSLADVVLMEDDGDTNYSSLAKALAAVLLTITDQGAYIPLVDAVIDAMPASWWTDDPDYVDSFYTLARETAGSRVGAAGNARMTVERYYVSAL